MRKDREEKLLDEIEFEKCLAELKKQSPSNNTVLMMDKKTQQIVLSWPSVDRKIVSNPIGNKSLDLCWHYTWFDVYQWAGLAAVTSKEIWDAFNPLAKMKMIYPDGTLPSVVFDFLKVQAEKLMDKE
jgi:hypothetical protein